MLPFTEAGEIGVCIVCVCFGVVGTERSPVLDMINLRYLLDLQVEK